MRLSKRDYAIIARALEIAGIAEIGDEVGSKDDRRLERRVNELAAYFKAKT
jgi:hypothetical protein